MRMTAPHTGAVDKSTATEKPEPRSIEAVGRTNGNAEANWRNVYDRPRRWRRVIVSPRRCAVRLNHIGAGIRAQSTSKRECEHCQCYQYQFFSHIVPCVVWRIEPVDPCEVAKRKLRQHKSRRAERTRNELRTRRAGPSICLSPV